MGSRSRPRGRRCRATPTRQGGMGGSGGKGGVRIGKAGVGVHAAGSWLDWCAGGGGWWGGGGERSRGAGREGELSSSEEGTGTAAGGGGCRGIGAREGGPKPQSEEAWRSTHRSEHLTHWPTAVPRRFGGGSWAGAGKYPAPSSHWCPWLLVQL